MIQSISVLGSTGSIGTQTLSVAEHLKIRVDALAAGSSIALLEKQARHFSPRLVAVYQESAARQLRIALADTQVRVVSGPEGLEEAAALSGADCTVTALSGAVGLRPTLAAIREKKRIALANKETLVCAGSCVMRAAEESGAEIVPVDSEHSAIFQCLGSRLQAQAVRRILLTGSGGPFRGMTEEETFYKTPAEAVAHPNWNMGAKISVDSATMMNKGLEFIEAMHLFSLTPDRIRVVLHPQSIVHSAVEFADGSVVAQLGLPDMRLPIHYALTWPERLPSGLPELDLFTAPDLHFEAPDLKRLPCLRLAMAAARRGGTAPCVLSAANEVAVHAFLKGTIPFGMIARCVEAVTDAVAADGDPDLEEILLADETARIAAADFCKKV